MDKKKEGLSPSAQEAIANAAKANVDAALKVASSGNCVRGRSRKTAGGEGKETRFQEESCVRIQEECCTRIEAGED